VQLFETVEREAQQIRAKSKSRIVKATRQRTASNSEPDLSLMLFNPKRSEDQLSTEVVLGPPVPWPPTSPTAA